MKKKIIKYAVIFLVIVLIASIFSISLITICYYSSNTIDRRTSYSSYLIICSCIILQIIPGEQAYNLSHVHYNYSSANPWDGYNNTSLFWLKYSAFLGFPYAEEKLGGYYYFKKKDLDKASYWMQRAVNHGLENAKEKLTLILMDKQLTEEGILKK